jgi:hypothetical protein
MLGKPRCTKKEVGKDNRRKRNNGVASVMRQPTMMDCEVGMIYSALPS